MAAATRAAAILLLLAAAHGVSGAGSCAEPAALSVSLDTLLAEYERAAPPAPAVLVVLALEVRHAVLQEYAAAVRLFADLRMSWQDDRLSWNATEWGCSSALVSTERLWVPDVGPVGTVTAGSGAGAGAGWAEGPLLARLSSDGAVRWVTRLDLSVPVALGMAAWPRDTHSAKFKFASRAHSIEEIDLEIQDMASATVFESGTWEVLSLTSETWSWGGGAGEGGARRVACWTLSLQRRAPAHALAVRAVLAAAALLLLAAALLPPATRAPLCACASFIAALWLSAALVRLPSGGGGGGAPRALSLVCALCVCGAAGCAGAALAGRLARAQGRPPAALRAVVDRLPAIAKRANIEVSGEHESVSGGAVWACAAHALDCAVLAALGVTVLVVGCFAATI